MDDILPPKNPESDAQILEERSWQRSMRPLMTLMILGLAIFFFAATYFQLSMIEERILAAPALPAHFAEEKDLCGQRIPINQSFEQCMAIARFQTAALLEAHSISRRYHQASVLLLYSVWSRYLAFTTGMILALVGATFVLGKLRDTGSELEGGAGQNWQVRFKSASPGLVLGTLGVILMIVSIVTLHTIEAGDGALYFAPLKSTGSNIQVP